VETIVNKEDRKIADGNDERSEVLQKLIEELGGMQREVMIRTSGKFKPSYIYRSLCHSSCWKSNPSWESNAGESITCSPMVHNVLAPAVMWGRHWGLDARSIAEAAEGTRLRHGALAPEFSCGQMGKDDSLKLIVGTACCSSNHSVGPFRLRELNSVEVMPETWWLEFLKISI